MSERDYLLSRFSKSISPKLLGRLGGEVVAHGTGTTQASAMIRRGAQSSEAHVGSGVFTTNSTTTANHYANHNKMGWDETHGPGWINVAGRGGWMPGRRKGKVLMFRRPSKAPLEANTRAPAGSGNEEVWHGTDLGKPIHTQNSHLSSSDRQMARERGVPRLPESGYKQPAPTPVSQLDPQTRKDRLDRARMHRGLKDVVF
jgi:hypothetical protein